MSRKRTRHPTLHEPLQKIIFIARIFKDKCIYTDTKICLSNETEKKEEENGVEQMVDKKLRYHKDDGVSVQIILVMDGGVDEDGDDDDGDMWGDDGEPDYWPPKEAR